MPSRRRDPDQSQSDSTFVFRGGFPSLPAAAADRPPCAADVGATPPPPRRRPPPPVPSRDGTEAVKADSSTSPSSDTTPVPPVSK
mmetsp:Transcript_48275/g.154779  ORF Transcript_48275/g.154779 Transcript_48275/m.154779 type:complete len:85 (-) Transcript_48275:608-862(-)